MPGYIGIFVHLKWTALLHFRHQRTFWSLLVSTHLCGEQWVCCSVSDGIESIDVSPSSIYLFSDQFSGDFRDFREFFEDFLLVFYWSHVDFCWAVKTRPFHLTSNKRKRICVSVCNVKSANFPWSNIRSSEKIKWFLWQPLIIVFAVMESRIRP